MYPIYRLKFEDVDLDPIEDYSVFDDWSTARAAFDAVRAQPDEDLGSAYLTEDDGEEERLILADSFV